MSPLAGAAASGVAAVILFGPWIIFGVLFAMVLYHAITDVQA